MNKTKNNPALKFEELKVGMRVWDKEDSQFYKIAELASHEYRDEQYVIFKGHEDFIEKYSDNRFYRKEVKE